MDTKKMRAEFEAWFCGKIGVDQSHLVLSRTDEGEDGWPYRVKGVDGDESYEVSAQVGLAWFAWQASRAAVVVELPSESCVRLNDYTPYEAVEACRRVIEAQGLKVSQ